MPEPRPYKLIPSESGVLHAPAQEVLEHGERLAWIARRLVVTAALHGGLAIAAPQIGLAIRLVATVEGLTNVANPTIVERHGQQVAHEGCLSYPGRWWNVERAARVVVEGTDPLYGRTLHLHVDGLIARMWQHEIDHLDGLVLDGRFEEITT